MLTLFLSSFLLAWGNPPTVSDGIWTTVRGNSELVITYDLRELREGDFVYVTVEYEYYDPKTSQWRSIVPSERAIKGANDDSYIQIQKSDCQKGLISDRMVIWDLAQDGIKELYKGEVFITVWTVSRDQDKELWKALTKEKRLNDKWLKANAKDKSRRAARLQTKIQHQKSLR